MSVVSRPVATGKTRTCPHCKAVILESLTICPGCMHHLRFDSDAAKRQVAANTALRVEGVIRHPPLEEAWEYYVVIAIRNDRGEEVTRQVVNVGALQPAEKRTFSLSVEVLPPQAPPEEVVLPVQDMHPAPAAPAMAAPKPGVSVSAAQAAGLKPPQPGAPAPKFGSAASRPAPPAATVRPGQAGPSGGPPPPSAPAAAQPASQSPQSRPAGSQPAQPGPGQKPGSTPLPPGGPKRH
jgi:hypothetical protein